MRGDKDDFDLITVLAYYKHTTASNKVGATVTREAATELMRALFIADRTKQAPFHIHPPTQFKLLSFC